MKTGTDDSTPTVRHWRSILGPKVVEELVAQAYQDAKDGKHLKIPKAARCSEKWSNG